MNEKAFHLKLEALFLCCYLIFFSEERKYPTTKLLRERESSACPLSPLDNVVHQKFTSVSLETSRQVERNVTILKISSIFFCCSSMDIFSLSHWLVMLLLLLLVLHVVLVSESHWWVIRGGPTKHFLCRWAVRSRSGFRCVRKGKSCGVNDTITSH